MHSTKQHPTSAHATRITFPVAITRKRRPRQDNVYEQNLTLDILQLKQDLHDLALRRQVLEMRALHSRVFHSRLNLNGSILQTVGQYFHGFARGHRETDREHRAYVRSIANAALPLDCLGTMGLGVEMLLEKWRWFTDVFQIRKNVVKAMVIVSPGDTNVDDGYVVVKVELEAHGLLSRTALDTAFPTARHDPQLLLRVLGQKIVIPMTFHLYINRHGRVERQSANADFCSALSDVLNGDAWAVARLVDDVRLGDEGDSRESTLGRAVPGSLYVDAHEA